MIDIKKWCLYFLAIIFSGFSYVAYAQQVIEPPIFTHMDEQGINLVTGKFVVPGQNLSIGNASSGLSRIKNESADNFSGTLNFKFYQMASSGAGFLAIHASLNGKIRRFAVGGGNSEATSMVTYSSPYREQTGTAQLSCTGDMAQRYANGSCTMTTEDGTVVTYGIKRANTTWSVTNILKPDGEAIDFYYYITNGYAGNIKSVASSLGWMLKYESTATTSKITAINTTQDYCDPLADSCSVSTAAPTLLVSKVDATTNISQNGTALLAFSESGNVMTLTTPSGVSKTITFSGSGTGGRVTSVATAGSTWGYAYTFNYSSTDGSRTITNPDQTTRKVNIGALGIANTFDENNIGQNFVYNDVGAYNNTSYGKMKRYFATESPYIEYGYDSRGNTTTQSVYPYGGGTPIVRTVEFPTTCSNVKNCNKPLTITEPNGLVTTFTYDPTHGGVTSETKSAVDGIQIKTTYGYTQYTPKIKNNSGSLVNQTSVWRLSRISRCMTQTLDTCAGTSDELVTEYNYNDNNLLLLSETTKRGDGSLAQTTQYIYDYRGNVIEIDGPAIGAVDKVYKFYDGLGRDIGFIGADPDASGSRPRLAQRIFYDSDGRVWKTELGSVAGTTKSDFESMSVYSYDAIAFNSANGLPSIVRSYEGSTLYALAQTSYDSRFRVVCEAERLNANVFNSIVSTDACILGVAGADGNDRITRYYYRNNSDLSSKVGAYGTSLARTEIYKEFYPSGKVSAVYDGKNNKTAYYYDLFNRLFKTCYANASSGSTTNLSDCEQNNYNADGSLGSINLRDNQTISYGHDLLGRLRNKSGAISETINYNNFDQVTSHTANGLTESYTYNSLGWLLTNTNSLGTLSYEYYDTGNRKRLTYPGGFYTTYNYNDGDELTAITTSAGHSITFDYDSRARRYHIYRPSNQTTTYGYSATTGMLQTLTNGSINTAILDYSQALQIKTKTNSNTSFTHAPTDYSSTYTFDGLNRISTVSGGMSFTAGYDGRGNLTTDQFGTYTYNANNLLISANQSGQASTLAYDGENRLRSITKNGVSTRFLYDGNNLIAEYDGSGNLLRRYVHSFASDEPLIWYEGAGTSDVRYFYADYQGSIVATTNSSGSLLNISTYDPYGVRTTTNSNYTSRFSYTGQIWLPEINLYNYKARMYSPTIGRFMQTDPLGYDDGLNWYAYVHGDPINRIDPLGTDDVASIPNPNGSAIEEVFVHGIRFNWNMYSMGSPYGYVTTPSWLSICNGDPSCAVDWSSKELEGYLTIASFYGGYGVVGNGWRFYKVAKRLDKGDRPNGVPEDWVKQAGRKTDHVKYVNPDNSHDYVRVKPDGTITQVRNGKAFDINGNPVNLKSPEAHGITSDRFIFRD